MTFTIMDGFVKEGGSRGTELERERKWESEREREIERERENVLIWMQMSERHPHLPGWLHLLSSGVCPSPCRSTPSHYLPLLPLHLLSLSLTHSLTVFSRSSLPRAHTVTSSSPSHFQFCVSFSRPLSQLHSPLRLIHWSTRSNSCLFISSLTETWRRRRRRWRRRRGSQDYFFHDVQLPHNHTRYCDCRGLGWIWAEVKAACWSGGWSCAFTEHTVHSSPSPPTTQQQIHKLGSNDSLGFG